MNYKETLFFIGKCLTINHEEHNKILVEEQLKSNSVNWDNVVKVSTGHYVFPALYCNLKRADFLRYLPSDLVEYMQYITQLNRERNEQIIKQAKELNELLLANNITPIFLKGTAFLLQDLYEDIAERMVGDIDFLVSENEFEKTITVVKNSGYSKINKKGIDTTIVNRHYPRMIKNNKIAAIEIHYKMVSNTTFSYFNYEFIKSNIAQKNKIHRLSDEDAIILTCLNKQLNDNGRLYKNFTLNKSYDLFLLSKKSSPLKAIQKLKNYNTLNSFLFSSHQLFNKAQSIDFTPTNKAVLFYENQLYLLENPSKGISNKQKVDFKLLQTKRIEKFLKAFYNKKYRKYLFDRIKSYL